MKIKYNKEELEYIRALITYELRGDRLVMLNGFTDRDRKRPNPWKDELQKNIDIGTRILERLE